MISELALHDPKRKIDFLDAILNRIAAWLEKKAGQLGAEERQKVHLHIFIFILECNPVRKRYKEHADKLNAVKERVIETQKDEMMYLNLIATDPICQGQGHGSRLLK